GREPVAARRRAAARARALPRRAHRVRAGHGVRLLARADRRARGGGRLRQPKGVDVNMKQIATDPDPYAPYLLSQGIRVGDLLLVSGQVGIDGSGELVSLDDFEAQADQAFRNLSTVLEAGGSSLDRVAKVTIFLTDMAANFPKVVELRRKWFTP